jgi:hypothetical protein
MSLDLKKRNLNHTECGHLTQSKKLHSTGYTPNRQISDSRTYSCSDFMFNCISISPRRKYSYIGKFIRSPPKRRYFALSALRWMTGSDAKDLSVRRAPRKKWLRNTRVGVVMANCVPRPGRNRRDKLEFSHKNGQ